MFHRTKVKAAEIESNAVEIESNVFYLTTGLFFQEKKKNAHD